MNVIFTIGIGAVIVGILGAICGTIYMLFDMFRERAWWYFFPMLFAMCIGFGVALVLFSKAMGA